MSQAVFEQHKWQDILNVHAAAGLRMNKAGVIGSETGLRNLARIGILVVSDRASGGEYKDKGGEAINRFLTEVVCSN